MTDGLGGNLLISCFVMPRFVNLMIPRPCGPALLIGSAWPTAAFVIRLGHDKQTSKYSSDTSRSTRNPSSISYSTGFRGFGDSPRGYSYALCPKMSSREPDLQDEDDRSSREGSAGQGDEDKGKSSSV